MLLKNAWSASYLTEVTGNSYFSVSSSRYPTFSALIQLSFVPETKIVDTLRFENYQRLDPNPGYGFALTGEKKISTKLNMIGGISDINHTLLNGDRYPRGTRVYFHMAYKITPELSVGPVIIQALGPLDSPALPRTRFEVIASYNVLAALHHYRIF